MYDGLDGTNKFYPANVLDCNIPVNKFELQSRYYVHFRTNVT